MQFYRTSLTAAFVHNVASPTNNVLFQLKLIGSTFYTRAANGISTRFINIIRPKMTLKKKTAVNIKMGPFLVFLHYYHCCLDTI